MPRIARMALPNIPYHITQRGNRGEAVFFSDHDRQRYLSWLRDYSERYGLDVIAYCLMTTHVHLVGEPQKADSLALTLRSLHMRHSQAVNAEQGWTGHLWQGRFFSTPLDEPHLWAAVRYVERNPVRAGMVAGAEDYRWSSAGFHLGIRPNRFIRTKTEWGGPIEDWASALRDPEDDETVETLRTRTRLGFPCGSEDFVEHVSKLLGRNLVLRGRGRPRKG